MELQRQNHRHEHMVQVVRTLDQQVRAVKPFPMIKVQASDTATATGAGDKASINERKDGAATAKSSA